MKIFVNSKSLDQRASDDKQVIEILEEFLTVFLLMEEVLLQTEFYRDAPLDTQMLTSNLTFKEALSFYIKQSTRLERTKIQLLFKKLSERPLSYNRFIEHAVCECCWEHPTKKETFEETGYAIAFAAAFSTPVHRGIESKAGVISFKNHPYYQEPELNVLYSDSSSALDERVVWNICERKHFLRHHRKYEANPKHKPVATDGGHIAAMVLDDKIAQQLLNQGIKLPNETRVIACKDKKLYMFPCHLVGNPDADEPYEGVYHGFEITAQDLQKRDAQFFAELKKVCDWPELNI